MNYDQIKIISYSIILFLLAGIIYIIIDRLGLVDPSEIYKVIIIVVLGYIVSVVGLIVFFKFLADNSNDEDVDDDEL